VQEEKISTSKKGKKLEGRNVEELKQKACLWRRW
jgi:hypothetical protein